MQVRPILPSTPINPILLKSASRGSHTARKHLMFATVPALLGGTLASSSVPAGAGAKIEPVSGSGSGPGLLVGAAGNGGNSGDDGGTEALLRSSPRPWQEAALVGLAVSYISIGPEAGFGGK